MEHWGDCSLKNLRARVHGLYWCCHLSLSHALEVQLTSNLLSWLWWEGTVVVANL
jgi:hypothetical protein